MNELKYLSDNTVTAIPGENDKINGKSDQTVLNDWRVY